MFESIRRYYYQHQEQNLHALKYAIAFALGYLSVFIFKNPYGTAWILITIAVVMAGQPIIGQQTLKGIMRLLGTVIGAFLGILTLQLPHYPILLFFVVFIVAFFLSRFAAQQDPEIGTIAVLGMVTFSLIVFMPQSNWHFALMRLTDIVVGIVISLLVSWFIFPLSARRAIIYESMRTFQLMAEFIHDVYIEKIDRERDLEVMRIDALITKGFTKAQSIARAGYYERLHTHRLKNEFNQLIRYLRAIFHYIIFIDVALGELSEKFPDNARCLRDSIEPTMLWLCSTFCSFEIEKRKSLSALDWDTYRISIRKMMDIAVNQSVQANEQIAAIQFSLRRIAHCLDVLVASWNVIQRR